ncbi:putative ribonuclease H protein [Vitis vinifera]|uniref:Putative ribonuclease H protein n=1 Tax=Vitis vinifera TaxID=29760 RepID=A0A438DKT2_VITVI|nr:putative ribonuclease H protein [Vitis vinifera]
MSALNDVASDDHLLELLGNAMKSPFGESLHDEVAGEGKEDGILHDDKREKSSQRRISSAMRKFAEIVDDLGLVDLPLQGGEFTWNGAIITRLGQDWTDSWCPLAEEQEIREGIANVFHQLLTEDMGWKADIGRLQFDQISQQEAENLEGSGKRWALGLSGWGGCGVAYPQLNFRCWLMGCQLTFSLALRALDKEIPCLLIFLLWEMEVLDVLIRRAVEGDFYQGVTLRVRALGLRINLAKSEIIPIGEVVEMEELVVELGCRVGSLPSQYLGLPLGAPNRVPYMWDGVEERVRRRLALWKWQYISKGGRITLIKSTLASMPIYQMSIFRMPKVVARRLEKVQRDFLWGGGNMEGKIHLVKWEVVCTDKDKGGLGLRKLAMLNKALLDKWIWRYACDKDNLWKQVIKAKYGQEGLGWRPKKANGVVGVGVWKEIWKELEWCWDNMIFRVGKGNTIRFWTDVLVY